MTNTKVEDILAHPSGYVPGTALVLVFFIVEIVIAVLSILLEVVAGLALDACGNGGCHYSLSSIAWYLMPISAVVILIVSGIVAAQLRHKGRQSWWIPLVGTAGIVIFFLFTQWLIAAAINQLPPALDPATYLSGH